MFRRLGAVMGLVCALLAWGPSAQAGLFSAHHRKAHVAPVAGQPVERGAGGESLRLLGPLAPNPGGAFGVPAEHERLRATHVRLLKWRYADAKALHAAVQRGERPYEVVEHDGNVMCTAGIGRLLSLLIGGGGTAYNASNSRIGVGDGTTSVAAADTDLSASSGSSHRWFQTPDSTFPSISGTTVTWQVTVTGSNGDFAWNEFGIDNGSSNGTTVTAPLLDHGLATLGTKASGTSWQLQVSITES